MYSHRVFFFFVQNSNFFLKNVLKAEESSFFTQKIIEKRVAEDFWRSWPQDIWSNFLLKAGLLTTLSHVHYGLV